ncbi:DUF4397 domain-containing protein [Micromonospora parathelypteridis]|uniref:DUF4397 domain-containing protein n=1 Tax=Micromonospora parathelypteridis TaxID=1839617 RepID=A0A840W087_9ACTN|nr:DUF4397 domain-containing protein [Micromonospora parathelypteridis]MBB5476641.1 hypothetical protein [Micromonospora parathelypteridis]GGO16253.1 hypothetical protein GCM10011576_28960 [Micromonospora parathelypteridis]
MHTLRTAPRRLLAGSGALLLSTALAAAGTPVPASAATAVDTVGYVRLAHLSPDTPAVDVYLAAPGAAKPMVFDGVAYGVVSDYLKLAPGRYAVAMREAGAPASDPPVLTTEVAVTSGDAYTVAGVGRHADLGLRVINDDLSAPAQGHAKVRVVQASVRTPMLDVAAADGPTIANGVQFATTTEYQQVEPGSFRLRLTGAAGPSADAEVRLTGGAVYSLLVLDAKQGGLTAELRRDAKGGIVVPAGGVDTGAGGTARAGFGAYPLVAGGLAAVAVAVTLLLWRRRRRTTW